MRFAQSVSFTETEQAVELARISEEVGFDYVMASDHLFFPERIESRYPYSPDGTPGFEAETEWPDPWVLIGAMAQATERVRFTTAVYLLPLRPPLQVAKTVATAAVLSGGRVALGIGAGWMREEFDAVGQDFATRGRRTDEAIEVLRKLWRGGMVEHHGEHYAFDRLQMSPAPPGEIPIHVGGVSPAALRRAGRLGDGWIGSGQEVGEVKALLDEIERHRREAGRAHLPFETIVPVTDPPGPEVVRQLEDAGATHLVSYPLAYTLGPGSSLEDKRAALERYGNDVIARFS